MRARGAHATGKPSPTGSRTPKHRDEVFARNESIALGFSAFKGDWNDIEYIKEYLGIKSRSEVIRAAIRAYAHGLRSQRGGG